MNTSLLLRWCVFTLCGLLISSVGLAQIKGLTDGRGNDYCDAFEQVLHELPEEVQYGVHIDEDGTVSFSIGSRAAFDVLFRDAKDGLAVDIVAKSQFDCNGAPLIREGTLPHGELIGPILLADLKKQIQPGVLGAISIRLGKVSEKLRAHPLQLEGNLLFIKNSIICYYTHFIDIDRSLWDLLPMGLHTDTLIRTEVLNGGSEDGDVLRYTKKLQVTVPFAKNKSTYNQADLKPLYDSLQLTGYRIKKISIRAYASVEGPEAVNRQLQAQRAQSMVKAFQQYQSASIKQEVQAMENWIEFNDGVQGTPHAALATLSRSAVKQKLQDKTLATQLEPLLQQHRKAIVTIYLDPKRGLEAVDGGQLAARFKEALAQKAYYKASLIQQEVFERIGDNALPQTYLNKLEIPHEKQYVSLLSDREALRSLYGVQDEQQALENFRTLLKLDSASGRIRYNICALTFTFWREDSAYVDRHQFLREIESLVGYGIDPALVKRMLINYHIVNSEQAMYRQDYVDKDNSLLFVAQTYLDIALNDDEVLVLAKYLAMYAKWAMAERIVEPRVRAIDVNENLLFYYINLKFYDPLQKIHVSLQKEISNALNINKRRFCRFFNSLNDGGASFQLLANPHLKAIYCDQCQVK